MLILFEYNKFSFHIYLPPKKLYTVTLTKEKALLISKTNFWFLKRENNIAFINPFTTNLYKNMNVKKLVCGSWESHSYMPDISPSLLSDLSAEASAVVWNASTSYARKQPQLLRLFFTLRQCSFFFMQPEEQEKIIWICNSQRYY